MKPPIRAITFAGMALLLNFGTAQSFTGGTATATRGRCAVSGASCDPRNGSGCSTGGSDVCVPIEFNQDGTNGEASAVQSGFFECNQSTKSSEETLLVLVNAHEYGPLCACVALFDGHSGLLFLGATELSVRDVDEISLCSLLPAPPAGGLTGVVEVQMFAGPPGCFDLNPFSLGGGAYGWVKDVVYSGAKRDPIDPFSANVLGIGKTELRVTPPGVSPGGSCPRFVPPVPASSYVQNTFE